jgi:hypothetical protein
MTDLVEPVYLGADTEEGGSGYTGTPERWRHARGLIADALAKSGTFHDIGCANGLLMERIVAWVPSGSRDRALRPRDPTVVRRVRAHAPRPVGRPDLRRQHGRLAAAAPLRPRAHLPGLRPRATSPRPRRPPPRARRRARRPPHPRHAQRGTRTPRARGVGIVAGAPTRELGAEDRLHDRLGESPRSRAPLPARRRSGRGSYDVPRNLPLAMPPPGRGSLAGTADTGALPYATGVKHLTLTVDQVLPGLGVEAPWSPAGSPARRRTTCATRSSARRRVRGDRGRCASVDRTSYWTHARQRRAGAAAGR